MKANIDAYFALYGRNAISGVFLDEMSSDAAKLSGYREIYAYIKAKGADLRVIGNPGMVPNTADYATVADVLVYPANDVLDIRGGEEPLLVPFVEDVVLSVDVPGPHFVASQTRSNVLNEYIRQSMTAAAAAGRRSGRTALRVVDRRTAADRIAVCSWKGFFRRRP